MLFKCWSTVCDVGQTLKWHWHNTSCLLRDWHNPLGSDVLSVMYCQRKCGQNETTAWAALIPCCIVKPKAGIAGKHPANTIHWPDAGSMLGQRRRRWPNIKPASGRCIVLTGQALPFSFANQHDGLVANAEPSLGNSAKRKSRQNRTVGQRSETLG